LPLLTVKVGYLCAILLMAPLLGFSLLALALLPRFTAALGLHCNHGSCPIHRSAWKGNSANFAC
jgi:hypothetical protein